MSQRFEQGFLIGETVLVTYLVQIEQLGRQRENQAILYFVFEQGKITASERLLWVFFKGPSHHTHLKIHSVPTAWYISWFLMHRVWNTSSEDLR